MYYNFQSFLPYCIFIKNGKFEGLLKTMKWIIYRSRKHSTYSGKSNWVMKYRYLTLYTRKCFQFSCNQNKIHTVFFFNFFLYKLNGRQNSTSLGLSIVVLVSRGQSCLVYDLSTVLLEEHWHKKTISFFVGILYLYHKITVIFLSLAHDSSYMS